MKAVLSLIFCLLALSAIAIHATAGPYRVDLSSDPAVIPVGRAKLLIKLTDATRKPVGGATVRVLAQMPGMTMGEREETATPGAEPGSYVARAVFGMSGDYNVRISVTGPLGAGETTIGVATGADPSGSGAGFPYGVGLATILVIGGVVLVVRRARRSGQKVSWSSLFNLQVVLSLLLLAAAFVGAVWAINSFRRPGSMTPIEAQVMDMSAPAPEGTLPVKLAKAESQRFGATVTYTGQAVGFTQQDVVPRVVGQITWMPFYVGDKVKKGQVVARLDTSQLDPMVSEKVAGVNSAAQGVSVATMEYQQAMSMVTQARAEVSMAEGELAEAKSMLEAAQQGRGSLEAAVSSSVAEAAAMVAELKSAQADLEYQEQELGRMRTLFEKGVLSKDEWQRTVADTQKARAAVDKAKGGVDRAQSGVSSARSELKKADAEINAARRRVQQAQAQVRAKTAAVATAQSSAAAAKAKIGQSRSSVAEAAAALRGANAQRSFAELRSDVDGVITDRLISPGVVVSPGQAILRIAQVSPIRLQANVPEADLAGMSVGSNAKVSFRDGSQPLDVKVTSISPAVDPNSRTGVVEALYSNKYGQFVPGQYVSMEISVGADASSTVVPSDAVETDEDRSFVWIAEPLGNGEFALSRKEVRIAGRAGNKVAIESGVVVGQQVVLSPPFGLVAGNRVTAEDHGAQSAQPKVDQTIEITAAGYVPPAINVPAGKAFKVTFIRRDDKSCGTEVIFPDLGIKKALPLNEAVTIEIPPQPAGRELNFTCPMDMLKGKAVAK